MATHAQRKTRAETQETPNFRPLSTALGMEVEDVDLAAPLSDTVFAAIETAFNHHCILLFRDQSLTPEQQIAFSERFGPLQEHVASDFNMPEHPAVFRVSNIVEDGVAQGRSRAGQWWHSDFTYMKVPAMGSVMYAIEVPEIGGDTLFANMYAAYDSLSQHMKAFIDDLDAVHDYDYLERNTRSKLEGAAPTTNDSMAKVPPVAHPVVRVQPDSGWRALYVAESIVSHIVGLPPDESDAILGFLFKHQTRHEFVYRHHWRPGDVVMWNNRCTLHQAINDYGPADRRLMHRTTIRGEAPLSPRDQ